ncbi:uncharacterized protein LOC116260692 [Nymphaea colorata]|nr:uncharacterized protein LOC116260692 [Nymphaea colorata]
MEQQRTVLFLRRYPFKALTDALESHGLQVLKPWESHLTLDAFLSSHCGGVRAVLVYGLVPIDSALLQKLPSLGVVVTTSIGLDHIDLPTCRSRGIIVANSGDFYTEDAADYAVGLLLDVLRRISASERLLRRGVRGDVPLACRVGGKRIGIVGLGRIGSAIARRLEAFGCIISYTSRAKKPLVPFTFFPNVLDLAAEVDALVLACALTEETHHIVDKEVLSALGRKGVVINIGRGPLVDEKELVSRLVAGEIGGAGLDVFEDEPNAPMELFRLDNVVLSPHAAVHSDGARHKMCNLIVANLIAFFENKPLSCVLCLLVLKLRSGRGAVIKLSYYNGMSCVSATRDGRVMEERRTVLLLRRSPFKDIAGLLESHGFCVLKPWESHLTLDAFLASHGGAVRALVVPGLSPIGEALLQHLPSLGLILLTSSGHNHVDLPACRSRGILVATVGNSYTDEVADYAVGLLLDLLRRVSASERLLRQRIPKAEPLLACRVGGKRVGIVGLGRIGSAIARRLEAFGCIISYTSTTKKPLVPFTYFANVLDLAAEADAIVLTCALTEETHHIVDKEVLSALGRKGVVINVGRGALVDEKELVRSLVEREVGGAGLDVFENEPDVPLELLRLDNVVLSPHAAVLSEESMEAMCDHVVANLIAFFENKPLSSVVD